MQLKNTSIFLTGFFKNIACHQGSGNLWGKTAKFLRAWLPTISVFPFVFSFRDVFLAKWVVGKCFIIYWTGSSKSGSWYHAFGLESSFVSICLSSWPPLWAWTCSSCTTALLAGA